MSHALKQNVGFIVGPPAAEMTGISKLLVQLLLMKATSVSLKLLLLVKTLRAV